ncbi:1-propanol dehydrogenase PduQ [Clostridium cochlearium]|uniref:1-propanol dehydrogenase PduQ n=1 Tax=Clostridium cochlearium TaxID=1494 RepID=UPI000B94D5B0|nr:1-propanol dehydrogenase PduQ [Clostridium cochlearium]MBV1818993.1 iron-containing alcohol dehydrogenase [Bacteroidales bacterium MSK.15.36]NSJ91193.1 iron-containing alcohol dehydrogenase [Coprococcus sp. MSK.21.13]MCG4572140.1 iron-containing alcohol dehydrogenase [Clostridium cochlearium]MCG4580586.1 iron-containing alcohol dehydrogenase [Clostridium cochlearium]NME96382.1 iron-containing alcohol dehydrogenase [Clostridium cochlearium]
MKEFSIKPKVYFGNNSIEVISKLKGKKALIVTDPFMIKIGFVDKIQGLLRKANIEYSVFSEVQPDPPIEIINLGIKHTLKFLPDIVIALGGGSAIDVAKGICVFSSGIIRATDKTKEKPLFVAIPTTSGTGSEVTAFSVVTDKKNNRKYPLYDISLTPDISILDVQLVKSVPKEIVADTGMDVLTHAIEAYVSKNASDYSDALAEKAIRLVFKYLIRSYKDPKDIEAKEKMHNASCLAGMAFNNASLGLNHGMAHVLGGKFHIPHGRANAIVITNVIEYNSNVNDAAKKYRDIAESLNLPCDNIKKGVISLIDEIKKLKKEINIPSLQELTINKDKYYKEITNMAKIALEDKCTATNPKIPTLNEVEELFKKTYI